MVANNISYVEGGSFTNLAILIEGFGTASGQYRFSWGPRPSFDSNNLYLDCLVGWPEDLGSEVDFREGSVTSSSQSFYVRMTDDTISLLSRLRPPTVEAEATSAIGPSSTSVLLTSTTLANTLIYWEREAIVLGTHSGGGTYTGCTRAALGTQAVRHGDSQEGRKADVEIFTEMPLETRKGRIVKLIRTPSTASSYNDEELLYVGLLDQINLDGALEFKITTLDALNLVKNVSLMTRPAKWDLVSSRRAVTRQAPDNGYGDVDAETNVCVVVEESSGYVGLARYEPYRDNSLFGFRLLDRNIQTILNFPKAPTIEEGGTSYREVHTTFLQNISNSASPDTWTLPLSREPAILILQLLSTFPNSGIARSNGDYDLGLDNLAGGVPLNLIDVDGILSWGDRVGSIPVDNLWLGLEGEENLYDVITRILRPFGALLSIGESGKITIVNLSDTLRADEVNNTILEKDILNVGFYQDYHTEDSLIRIQVEYGLIPGVGTSQIDTLDEFKNKRLPQGGRSQIEINADFISSQALAQAVAQTLLFRFRYPPMTVVIETMPHISYYPGDTVLVSHSQILNHKSVGVEEGVFLIIGRREILGEGQDPSTGGLGSHSIVYTMSFVGAIYNRQQRYIAPNGLITAWNAGTKTISLEPYGFATTRNEFLNRDSEGFQAGDFIQIVNEYGEVEEALCEIDSVGTNSIVLVDSPVHTPIAGDIIRIAPYPDASQNQKDKWAYIADTDGTVDSLSANSSSYVIGG